MSDRKRFVFRSQFHGDTLAYVWDLDRWEWRNQGIHGPAAQFQTYGDGMVQHSGEFAVGNEQLADFLISLSAHLLENPADVELVARRWPDVPTAARVEFFAKLRYDEKKRRYYNRSDLKVSTAESKRHDRRWEEVPTSADGSLEAVLRLCIGDERHTMLELLAIGLATTDNPEVYDCYDRRQLLKWLGADTEFNRSFVRSAFTAVQLAVDALQAAKQAKGHAECLENNIQRWRESEAEKAADAVEPAPETAAA